MRGGGILIVMQNIATRVFIYASLAFGVLGIVMVLTTSNTGPSSDLNTLLTKLLAVTVFIILPSFALSVASKYLSGR